VWLQPSTEEDQRGKRRAIEKALEEEYAARRVRVVDELGRAYATGKRKAAIARVWIWQGPGTISINHRPLDVHFPQVTRRAEVLAPFQVCPFLCALPSCVAAQQLTGCGSMCARLCLLQSCQRA
jgi:small subunit ribosomal protein S9